MFGRDKEKKLFDKLVSINEPHFVAVYGRRRVGKTFLIREHFKNKFCFTHTGAAAMDMGIWTMSYFNYDRPLGLIIRKYSKQKAK